MSANEELRDRALRHVAHIARYEDGAADKLIRLLNKADAEIVSKLAGGLALMDSGGQILTPIARKRLEKLLDEIRVLNAAIYKEFRNALFDELSEFAAADASYHQKALSASLAVDLDIQLPTPARLKAIIDEAPMTGRLLSSWADKLERDRLDAIGQALRLGMVQRETDAQIITRIRGTKASGYTDGVIAMSRNSAQALVRTAVSHVSNTAAQEIWRANDGVVKGWQFLATLDTRTTSNCASRDGEIYPIGEGPIPPLHIRCRSLSIPVTKSWKEMGLKGPDLPKGTRASMDGQVAGRTTYPEWLKNQSAARQDEALGKTRAELFRTGKLDIKDMVKSDGTKLTLDQLKKLYPTLLS